MKKSFNTTTVIIDQQLPTHKNKKTALKESILLLRTPSMISQQVIEPQVLWLVNSYILKIPLANPNETPTNQRLLVLITTLHQSGLLNLLRRQTPKKIESTAQRVSA